jgi:hypothetical protein
MTWCDGSASSSTRTRRAQRAIDGPRNAFVSADEDVEPLLFDEEGMFVLPARVLREIDAKRQIVERYAWLREHGDTGGTAWVLPLLALPYADRPGYREEWRP